MATLKTIESDADFNKTIKANKFVLAIFMEDDTELEVSITITTELFVSHPFRPIYQT